MKISISYYLGEDCNTQYFDNYKEAIIFIKKLQEVINNDFFHFEFYVYSGKEEERIIKLLSSGKEVK